jgi:hypothetical protein
MLFNLQAVLETKVIGITLFAVIVVSCNSGKKIAANGSGVKNLNDTTVSQSAADGKSFKTAIVINENSEMAGVHAEYQWIRDHYTDYKVVKQTLVSQGKKPFDIITIEFADKTQRDIYFDISNFLGHL